MAKSKTNLKKHLVELFDVFKHERKGFMYFAVIILGMFALNWSFKYWVKPPSIETSQLDSLMQLAVTPQKKTAKMLSIEINTSDTVDWMQLGFSRKQVKSILKYREAVGQFKSISQVEKIYIIDSLRFQQIRPFLRLNKSSNSFQDSSSTSNPKWNSRKNVTTYLSKKVRFPFDPNTISFDSLRLLGMHQGLASSLIKYREKVKQFKSSDDLLELYLYDSVHHSEYKPYIQIDTTNLSFERKEKKVFTYEKEIQDTIELNSADTFELMKLRGVGRFYAAQIIRYRNKLGGYYSKQQLTEIKSIRQENLDKFWDYVVVDSTKIKTIPINTCEFKELLKHPYFDYYETKLIFSYRDEQGKFISLRDLKKAGPLTDRYVEKIGHYISF